MAIIDLDAGQSYEMARIDSKSLILNSSNHSHAIKNFGNGVLISGSNVDSVTSGALKVFANNTSTAGLLRIQNIGTGDAGIMLTAGTQTFSIGVDNSNSDQFTIGNSTNIGNAPALIINSSEEITLSNLAGSGDRMVVANSSGVLSTQSIPSGGGGGSGDIEGVTAGAGLTGGGTTGTVSLAVGAGTGIDVAADAVSVDVSDFMTNGSNNRVVTATGADAMNAETDMTFDGDQLTLAAPTSTNGGTIVVGRKSGQANIVGGSGNAGYLIMESDDTGTGRAALNWYTDDDVILAYGGGNTGVGTNATLGAKFHVSGDISGSDVYAQGKIGSNIRDYITFTANTQMDVYVNNSNEFRFESDGDFHADGDIIGFSSTVSDSRLKDNIITLGGALDKIKSLRGVSYTWNSGKRKNTDDIGLIAQEVEKILPEVITEKKMPLMEGVDPDTDYKTVNYEKIVPVLIEAIKEQQEQIDKLKKQIESK